MTEVNFRIEVPILPEWRNVDLLRTSILSCLAAIFQSDDFCHTISMVAGELIENAIKFGDWQTDDGCFRLHVRGDGDDLAVEVSNPYAAGSDAPGRVQAIIAALDGYESPKEAYTARLHELAKMPLGTRESRLGLLRIAYEGGCSLHASTDPGNVLRVTALTTARTNAHVA
jgi:hypothetical protein